MKVANIALKKYNSCQKEMELSVQNRFLRSPYQPQKILYIPFFFLSQYFFIFIPYTVGKSLFVIDIIGQYVE